MAWASRNAMRVEGRKQCIAQKKIYRTRRPLIERHSKPKSEKCVYKRQLQNTSLALGTRTLSATRFLRIAESVVAAWEKAATKVRGQAVARKHRSTAVASYAS